MPYVITTKQELPTGGLPHGEHPHDYGYPKMISRRAVATLEEAKTLAWNAIHEVDARTSLRSVARLRWAALSESGGTVGPLPDGTVIEVEPITWDGLGGAFILNDDTKRDLLMLFNMAQEARP